LRAQSILEQRFKIAADVWSVTSYGELRREALAVDRWNRLHPAKKPRVPYVVKALEGAEGPIIAASDYIKILPDGVASWFPGRLASLGTDGFGRSENRQHLRRFFENDAESIATAALSRLAQEGKFDKKKAEKAIAELGIDPEKKESSIS
jgi:pyruvate dehydrogenase E1 component